ncbi:hypothetical protein [uncultured Sulfitobacter sp.]|uniref:hypothetical protein n=1 Tax=uncultured Sulfitobacter sp. TaxID=191468 RepID=UPI0026275331|nr:hypothetical protein [uncultured Sulfitobacter sp.]
MNRRQFTASLGALAGAAALPFPALRAATAAAPAVPPTAYAWAHLIVRAQAKASPAMLARQLGLSPEVAQSLFDTLIRDGVLRAPGAAGIAQAAHPLHSTGHTATAPQALRKRMQNLMERAKSSRPLVKDDTLDVGCSKTVQEKDHDASTPEYIQESPVRG